MAAEVASGRRPGGRLRGAAGGRRGEHLAGCRMTS